MKAGFFGADTAPLVSVLLLALIAGCSTMQTGRTAPGQRLDPWENWNRKVFAFNEGLDEKVLKPVATVYSDVVPQPVRIGVGNFFSNVLDAWSAINNMLQGKFTEGFDDVTRVGTNTLFGLFGIVDVATEMGLDHHYEDFGQTLGRWGVGAGAYVVLPVLGPSSLRDAAAMPLDRAASPALLINNGSTQFGITTLQIINTRASLLGATRVIDDISLDKYTFIRDAYLQRRRSLVFDGDVPESPDPSGPAAPPTQEAPAPNAAASVPSPAVGASAPK
jgi:phospholipid-binding lipoprotein MlaA